MEVEPDGTEEPPGIISGTGSIFRAMRGPNRRQRAVAIVFAALFFTPIVAVAVAFVALIVRSI